jgi:hypothetical protein
MRFATSAILAQAPLVTRNAKDFSPSCPAWIYSATTRLYEARGKVEQLGKKQ